MRSLPRRCRWGLVSLVLLLLASALPALPFPLYAGHAEAASSRTAAAAAYVARSYVGYRYAWIGDKPWTGFSCVGLVHWSFARVGVRLPESLWQLNAQLYHVPAAQMRPGDILLFANTYSPGLSHAAIYLGNGLMVGADNFSVGVHVDYVWDAYWGRRFYAALRP